MERKMKWALEFPVEGGWTRVLNSECETAKQARTLLSDRIANGQSFDGERVIRIR